MGLTKAAVKILTGGAKLESFDRFMFIGPHPDDIEIGAGATAAKLVKEGKKVCFLICTDGRFGDTYTNGIRGEELAKIRKEEAKKSAGTLGVGDVRFLGFSDGALYDFNDLKKAMAAEIGSFKPDVIFAPDPEVASECHQDHLNVGRAAREMAIYASNAGIMEAYHAERAGVKALAFYITAKPNRFVDTTGMVPLQMRSIFDCHKSQYPDDCPDISITKLYLRLRAHEYGLRSLHGTAEGFRVLSGQQMHFLPEAED